MWHNHFQLLLTEWRGHWVEFWWLWIIFIVVLVSFDSQPPGGTSET